jgi:GntR family transcriptional regulator of vanillate catabolism
MMSQASESRSNLSLRAYRYIHRKLWRGELAMGSKLPEVALAQEIGVSRTPVREAVAQLESEGFVVQFPNAGSFVRLMQRDELDELFDFRIHLECYALELVMQSNHQQLQDRLRRICDRMFKLLRRYHRNMEQNNRVNWLTLRSNWHLLDAEFHELILMSANNRWIQRVSSQMHLMSRIFIPGRRIDHPPADMLKQHLRVWREHRQIIQSIQRHDLPMGHQVLHKHIEQGRIDSLAFMDWVESRLQDKPAALRKLPKDTAQLLSNIIKLRELDQLQQGK